MRNNMMVNPNQTKFFKQYCISKSEDKDSLKPFPTIYANTKANKNFFLICLPIRTLNMNQRLNVIEL